MASVSRRLLLRRRLVWVSSLLGLVLLISGFVFWPIYSSQFFAGAEPPDATQLEGMQAALHRAMQVTITLWLFALGASFASFVNVVAYRMPRGISIIGSSRCPRCRTKLTFRENVPVIGWLVLNGRCRTCHLPIAVRYVAVEILLGLVFVGLMVVELLTAGANLPNQPAGVRSGFVEVLFGPNWRLISIYSFHLALMTWLLTACLVRLEPFRLPWKLVAFALLIGFAAPQLRPDIYPVLFADVSSTWMTIGFTGIMGWILGVVSGSWLYWHFRGWFSGTEWFSLAMVAAVIGLFLGWQSVISTTALCMILVCLAPLFSSPRRCSQLPLTVWLTVACLGHIGVWRWLDALPFWPSQNFTVWGLIGPTLVLIGAPIVQRFAGYTRN